ncbi:hypothetical protein Goarm_013768 [Gossypium armourianum]|uniref:chitinase n=1 Tax=Gossypium armourianum TaxID=34283 RepID=A0A7J9J560_9ROSI|nr:hypothetical protein [Gossypium armourianum]
MRAPALSFCSNVFPGSTPQCEKQPGSGTAIFPQAQWGCRGSNSYQRLKKISFRSNCNKGDAGCGCGGGSDGGGGLSSIVTREVFEEMLPYRNDPRCPAAGFYTYDALMEAAKAYPAFAATGDDATRKREVAAFFGQTSHETSGGVGWNAPGGPYVWGYCFTKQINPPSDYLDKTCKEYPCVPGQKYYGRGPIQLTWNYNYGQFGATIGMEKELLENPDLIVSDATLCFQSALWFWMTPQGLKPSCHDVITGAWTPSARDVAAGRFPGYGVITNIVNGGLCGRGWNAAGEDLIGFYKRYCDMFGVSYGDCIDCYNQKKFSQH